MTPDHIANPTVASRVVIASLRPLRRRPGPLLDPCREQVYHLSDTGRAQVWAPGRRIDPAQVGLAVKLRQRVEEGGRLGAGLQRRADVVGKISALRALWRQFNSHILASGHVRIAHPHRGQRKRPSPAARRDHPADPPAVDRSAYRMLRFGTPELIGVERHRDNPAATRTRSNAGTEPLKAHGPSWHRPGRIKLGATILRDQRESLGSMAYAWSAECPLTRWAGTAPENPEAVSDRAAAVRGEGGGWP